MLKNSKLYLILDRDVNSYGELLKIAEGAFKGGVDIVQLRDKHGSPKEILEFSGKMVKLLKNKIPFIINDRIDLALAVRASGVHVGQDDVPIVVARKLMGPAAIIGTSCQTLAQAKEAERQGADYIGFGSVYKTLTKPQRNPMDLNLLAEVVRKIWIPVFAIGGITLKNITALKEIGVNRMAVCRAICAASDVEQTTLTFKTLLG